MIPSLDALGGWGRRPRSMAQVTLADLYTKSWRFVDTPYFNYRSFLRSTAGLPYDSLSADPGSEPLDKIKVAVIGAGIAGIISAYELAKLGAKVTLYEATARIGGRLYTEEYSGIPTPGLAEMGAMRVPESACAFWHYFGLTKPAATVMNPFPNPGIVYTALNFGSAVQTWGGSAGGAPSGVFETITNQLLDPAVGVYNTQIVFDNKSISDIYTILANPTPTPADLDVVASWWHQAIQAFDEKTFLEATLELVATTYPAWDENTIQAFATLGFGTGGFGPLFPISFLDILRLIIWQYSTEFEVPDGMSTFAQAMLDLADAESLKHSGIYLIKRFGIRVTSIESFADKVTIKSAQITENFDYVIATGTARSMQRYGLDLNGANAAFDASHVPSGQTIPAAIVSSAQTGLRQVNMVGSSKVFFRYQNKPWGPGSPWPMSSTGEPVKVVLSDKLFRQSYFLDPNPTVPNAPCIALISYAWNNESTKVAALTPAERMSQYKSAYLGSTSQPSIFNDIGNTFSATTGGVKSITWEDQPTILGGFKLDAPGGYYHTAAVTFHYTLGAATGGLPAAKWQRVYVAGDTMSFYGGWVEGAMMSAINAVTAVTTARNMWDSATATLHLRSGQVMDWTKVWGFNTSRQIAWTKIGTV